MKSYISMIYERTRVNERINSLSIRSWSSVCYVFQGLSRPLLLLLLLFFDVRCKQKFWLLPQSLMRVLVCTYTHTYAQRFFFFPPFLDHYRLVCVCMQWWWKRKTKGEREREREKEQEENNQPTTDLSSDRAVFFFLFDSEFCIVVRDVGIAHAQYSAVDDIEEFL